MKNKKNKLLILAMVFFVVFVCAIVLTPKGQSVPDNGMLPDVHDVETTYPGHSGYRYIVWKRPDKTETVFLCYEHGTGKTHVFGMAQAVNSDGSPTTPEDVGVDSSKSESTYPIPNIYDVETPYPGYAGYRYVVWKRPDGTETVFLCYKQGSGRTGVFGMTQAVNSDGSPSTPEDLNLVYKEEKNDNL